MPAGETLVEGDIRDARTLDRAIDGADVIFHQAGVVSVDRSVEAPCGATR
nr:NAD-dependent epimerase/dehydratase family protein [Halegenticoccus tardaugens]